MGPPQFYINQRLCLSNALCTIKYIGSVEGTTGQWLGVEWDEPARGKHSGENAGKKYFDCIIENAGSFVRPTRASDPPLSFVQALRKKYIDTGEEDAGNSAQRPIEWGGKVVEEVGFDKIRQKLRKIKELKIILVDGMQISHADPGNLIQETCPNIEELNLSRNLFESLQEVELICRNLPKIRSLRLSGNRITNLDLDIDPENPGTGFDNIESLELEETLVTWDQLATILPYFPSTKTIDLSLNRLPSIPHSISSVSTTTILPTNLTEIKLEKNFFTSLASLAPLSTLTNLRKLLLAHNHISSIHETAGPSSAGDENDQASDDSKLVFEHITYLDLSFNLIPSFAFIDAINTIFPNVEALRVSHNPLYQVPGMGAEEAHMLTVGRLSWKVRLLNYSTITMQERTNAELYYLGKIAKELAEVPEDKEEEVIMRHDRWKELTKLHGVPVVNRNPEADKQSLGRNLIHVEFIRNHQSVEKKIPKATTVSALKGIVGYLFDTKPLKISLRLSLKEGDMTLEDELRKLEHYAEDRKEIMLLVDDVAA